MVGLNGTRVSVQEDEEFWRWMVVAASGQGEDITPQAGKMVKMVNVLPCVFYHNRQREGKEGK